MLTTTSTGKKYKHKLSSEKKVNIKKKSITATKERKKKKGKAAVADEVNNVLEFSGSESNMPKEVEIESISVRLFYYAGYRLTTIDGQKIPPGSLSTAF